MVRLAHLAGPTRIRRAALALLGVIVVAVVAMSIRATIAVETARGEVETLLTGLAGRPLKLGGAASVRLVPWPTVRFTDATLTDGDAPVARAERLDVTLDVAALLLGRLRAEEIRALRPDVRLALGTVRLTPADLAARLAAWKPLSLKLEGGRLVLATPSGDEVLDRIEARFGWPRPSANATLSAGFRWRGEAVSLDLETPSPAGLLAGDTGTLALRLASAPLRLAVSGSGGLTPRPRFDGTGDFDVLDAARFARWTGLPRTPDLLAGRLRLDGPLKIDAEGAVQPTVRVDLAGNRGEGALTWRWDQLRPRLGGTIAFADLDFTTDKRRPFGGGWRTLPLDDLVHALDYDLRLSAGTVRLPGVTLAHVAAAFHAADRRFHAEIGNADLFGKPISLVARGTLDETGLRAQVRGFGEDLPLAELAGLAEVPGIEGGRASAAIEAETRCRLLGDCLAGLAGRLSVDARALTVTGASPFAEISRFRPIVPQSNGARVTTTWERVGVDLGLTGSRASVDRVEILGQSARFLFTGSGDLATGELDLVGNAFFPAFRPDPARTGSSEITVPMRIGGTLGRPLAMARDPAATNGTPATGQP